MVLTFLNLFIIKSWFQLIIPECTGRRDQGNHRWDCCQLLGWKRLFAMAENMVMLKNEGQETE